MNIICNICDSLLREPGALAFSPPDEKSNVTKIHICVECWNGEAVEDLFAKIKETK